VRPHTRVRLLVALAAMAAAGVVAGVVYATRQDPVQPKVLCRGVTKPLIVPGVPSKNVAAVEAAFARGPRAAARALEPLAQANPKDPVVLFNDGTALYCSGYVDEAAQAYTAAKKAGYNTYYRIKADELLHPQFFQDVTFGYPLFQYTGGDRLLVEGQVEQRAGRQVSAERLWAKAAKLHPDDPNAQVAAAVGRFDMSDLSASFSRLGPLVVRFPKSQTVRFHLGYLLSWTGQADQAVKEFRATVALGPNTTFGKEANAFLKRLVGTGSGAGSG
jgi:tetratricopeptide (TPR) repeat protein